MAEEIHLNQIAEAAKRMTTEEYRKHPALNFSLAKHLLKSPAHFKAAQDEEREETDAMRVGTLAHAMILEGKNLLDLYAIKPKGMSFATKEGKVWRDNQTLPILSEDDAVSIPRMAESITENIDAALILNGCTNKETPVFALLQGVECKALLDAHDYSPSGRLVIADFKTTVDASPRKFASTVFEMDYDMQQSWYSDILALSEGSEVEPRWFWIVSEKKSPFANAVYTPDDEMMQSGRSKVSRALSLYKECVESGQWPMPYKGITRLCLPKWAKS